MSNRKSHKSLRVALIAPPWIALPAKGYGGIERVIESIAKELVKQGMDVELFANGARKMRGIKTHSFYKQELFDTIDWPYYDAPLQAMQTHLNYALKIIEEDGGFDIIHDHNPYIGTTYFSLASRIKGVPPVLHTFHGPPFSDEKSIKNGQLDNRPQLELMHPGRLYTVCISAAMAAHAPTEIRSHMLEPVHNAVDVNDFEFEPDKKSDYYITLARFTADKAQHVAMRFAIKNKKRLRMAGTVAGMTTNRKVLLELSNPLSPYRKNEEFRYFSDKILPSLLRHPRITYAGDISGIRKKHFLSRAKALLFPINWDEPFGMVVIEALASGTPVVAMNRGAMPEIIEHGVNGFLANTHEEFEKYALRVDEIDPHACRESVKMRFSSARMTSNYITRYREILERER